MTLNVTDDGHDTAADAVALVGMVWVKQPMEDSERVRTWVVDAQVLSVYNSSIHRAVSKQCKRPGTCTTADDVPPVVVAVVVFCRYIGMLEQLPIPGIVPELNERVMVALAVDTHVVLSNTA